MIRAYQNNEDYNGVTALCRKYDLATFSREEIASGTGFVAISDKTVVGFIWALHSGSMAYIDILVVDEEFREKGSNGRSKVGIDLGVNLFAFLCKIGITRAYCLIRDGEIGEMLNQFYSQHLGMVNRNIKAVLVANPVSALIALRGCHG